MTVETFPQHQIKPTMAEILMSDIPEEARTKLYAAYPNATGADVTGAFNEAAATLDRRQREFEREATVMKEVHQLCRPLMEQGLNLGEALKQLSDEGNELAAKHYAYLTRPGHQKFLDLMNKAADLDPYWHRYTDTDGRKGHTVNPGAVYDTAEKLVAAYCRQNNIEYPL